MGEVKCNCQNKNENEMARKDEEYEKEIKRIKLAVSLPLPPELPSSESVVDCSLGCESNVERIQQFISKFEYNYSGVPFVVLKQTRKASELRKCAERIIALAYPIQCVEAVFIGAYLSRKLKDLVRIPLCFKSCFDGQIYRHIVMAVCSTVNGTQGSSVRWGAIGLSRRDNLMFKEMKYQSLFDLVLDYERSYRECFHVLLTAYLGEPFPHHLAPEEAVTWKAVKIRIYQKDKPSLRSKFEEYCEQRLMLLSPSKSARSTSFSNKRILRTSNSANSVISRVYPTDSSGRSKTVHGRKNSNSDVNNTAVEDLSQTAPLSLPRIKCPYALLAASDGIPSLANTRTCLHAGVIPAVPGARGRSLKEMMNSLRSERKKKVVMPLPSRVVSTTKSVL